jgi:FimV-like protein
MGKSINAILLVLAAVLVVPAASYAAGLGTITVRSALGQPLDAEIEVVSVQRGEDFQVRLASREAYAAAGVDLSPALQGARFAIEQRNGKTLIRVRTTQPMNDPFFTVLVELQWPTGRLARQYTVLVDPAEYKTATAAAPAPQAAITAPAPAVVATPAPSPSRPPAQTPKAAAKAPAAAPAQPAPVVVVPAAPAAPAKVAAQTRTAETSAVPAPAPAPVVAPPSVRAPAVEPAPAPAPAPAPVAAPAPEPALVATPALQPAPVATAAPQPAPVAIPAPTTSVPAPAQQVVAAPEPTPLAASKPRESPENRPSSISAKPVETPVQPVAAAAPAPVAAQATPAPATPVTVAPIPSSVAQPSAPVTQAAAAPVVPSAADSAKAQSTEVSDTYRIKRGDTLGAIARKWKPDGVSYEQMLVGLFQTNRPIFIRDNINLIRAGATIFIPGREDVLATSAADAARQVRTHMAAFSRYRETAQGAGSGSSRISQAQRDAVSRRVGVKKSTRAM